VTLADSARDSVDEALARLVCAGALGVDPTRARIISDDQVEAAITIAEASGICDQLAEWRAESLVSVFPEQELKQRTML